MLATKRFFGGILLLICIVAVGATCSANTLSIPNGVSAIEAEAFAGSGVQTVVIPSSVQSIGSRAFADCASLTDVYLPAHALEIAVDAFDISETTVFHVYMGSANATWARERDYRTEYITGNIPSDGSWNQVNTLIATEPIGNKNADRFYTYRLIVKMSSGVSLPDLQVFNPKKVVSLDADRYVLQFNNSRDTENCYEAFYAMKGKGCVYCESDYFLSYEEGSDDSNTMLKARSISTINRNDPMGFSTYTNYIGDSVGKITIAIIDDGVDGSLLSDTKIISNKSYDFIYNARAIDGFGNSHGTKVAKAICDAFGSLATSDHLSIISYRIEKPSNGDISYIMMGEAIIQARLDGASLLNISIAGESSYANDQENQYLAECISYFGKGSVIAAAGNRVAPANNHLPAKYCGVKAGAAQFKNNTDPDLMRADGTATGATISGFATTTSIATARVTAAYALLKLGSGDLSATLENVQDGAKMPNLAKLVIKPVESITLNNGDPIENILWVGDRLSIDFEVLPADATNNKVNVVPENPEIISIVSNNYTNRVRVSADAPGTTHLIFTSDDGNVTVPVTITVIQPVTEVIVSGYNGETLMQGQKLELTAIVNPDDASDQTVRWSSSNPNIAKVQEPGIVTRDNEGRIVNKTTVTQVGEGQVVITATSNYDETKYDQTDPITVVNEPEPGTVIVYAESRITSVSIGASPVTVQMYAEVLPEGANQTVTWSAIPESIASIDSTGLLTISGCNDPLGRDNVRIYAESYNGKLGYCDITVIQLPTSITISGANSVIIGETTTLTATISPSNAANKNVRWISGHPATAMVATDGTVEGVSAGTAMIQALSAADGSVFATHFVNVAVLPESVTISQPVSTILDIDQTLALSATINPENATNQTLTWTPDDSSVATVNASGVVTAKASGTVTITVSTFNSKTDSIELTVRQPYTLNFDANGGSTSTASKTAYSGYPVGSLPTPTRIGYTFIGWFRATGESAQVTDSTEITSSSPVTIYAHWKANTYDVTLNNQSTTSAGSTSVKATYDNAMPSITLPARTGYTFNGYYTEQDGNGTQYYSGAGASARNWNLTSDTTLYAYWTANTYTVTLNNQNATIAGSTSVEATYNAAMPSFTKPDRTGYTFGGYYTEQNGSGTQYYTAAGDSTRNWNLTNDTILYAYWTANTYTVTLNNQSATTAGSTSVKATYNAAMPSLTKPTRTGYTFGGYYTEQNGSGTQYYTAAGASARNWNIADDTTLYAYWTANIYTVTLNNQSATTAGSTSVKATYNAAMPSFTKPAKTGYAFGGYYTAQNGSGTQYYTAAGASARNWNLTNNTTLYAHWTANIYTVTLNNQSATTAGSTSVKATYNAAMPSLTKPARTGYTFGGYYTAQNGSGTQYYTAAGASARNWNLASNTTLYAYWTGPNSYTLTYNANGGSVSPTTKSVTYSNTYGTLATPTRTGYTFAGWFTAASGGTQVTSSTKVTTASNHTIYAHWTGPNDYTYSIVYKSSNGTSLGTASITKTFGTTNTVTPPAKAGYITPSAQSVKWDATSKTISFTYTPDNVAFTTKSGNFFSNGHIKYSAEIQYQNRTATSVQLRVVFNLTRNTTAYTIMRISFFGSCSGVNIPTTTVVPFNAWKSASSTDIKRTGTSDWITIPLTTTDQTTLDVKVECWQYNSGGTKMTGSDYARLNTTWPVSIPAY